MKSHTKKHEGENEDNILTKDGLDWKTVDNIVTKGVDVVGNEYNFITKGVHDVGRDDNIVTKGLHDGKTNEEQICCTDGELEKRESAEMEEFNRKIELGRKLNKILNKHGFNENIFEWEKDMKEALKTYKLYGKTMDMKDIAELTNIQGRKLEKRKEQIKHFDAGDVEPEKENIDSDASRNRKSSIRSMLFRPI